MSKKRRTDRARAAATARWDRARAAAKAAKAPAVRRVSDAAVAGSQTGKPSRPPIDIFRPAEFPKRAVPKGHRMAMDANILDFGSWAWGLFSGIAAEGQTFLGYPYLSELSQRPEYRRMVEQLAYHMTRRWIRIKHKAATPDGSAKRPGMEDQGPLKGEPGHVEYQAKLAASKANGVKLADKNTAKPGVAKPFGAQDAFPPPKPGASGAPNGSGQADPNADPNAPPGAPQPKLSAAGTPLVEPEFTQEDHEREQRAAKLTELENELKRLHVKQLFKEVVEQDGFFGRSHIFVDLGAPDDKELATPIANADGPSPAKIPKGQLKGLKTVEPMWVYPMGYEAMDPLSPSWYRPDQWYVMKRQVHRTRLLTFVSREVPDLLKPAYAFGGLPLTQIAKPYVDNWLKTRQSVSDLIQSFSQFVVATDLLPQLASTEGSQQLFKRLDVFNNTRNSRGVMAIDKEKEELTNVSAPLGSLDALQAQSQEHMSSVSGIPIMFLLGDQPSGLNASSEGSIRAFYDWIEASQEFLFENALDTIIKMAQLNIWGEIDEDITFEFVTLWTPTEKEEAEMRKADSDRDTAYIQEGVVSADEVRQKLAQDPNSGYTLDLSKKIEPPAPEPPPFPGAGGGDGDDAQPGAPQNADRPPPGARPQ